MVWACGIVVSLFYCLVRVSVCLPACVVPVGPVCRRFVCPLAYLSAWLLVCLSASQLANMCVNLFIRPSICLLVGLSFCLPVCLLPVSQSIGLYECLPVCLPASQSIGQSVCLPVCPSPSLSVYVSVCLSPCLLVCLPVLVSACLSACQPVCLSVCQSVSLPICVSTCSHAYLPLYHSPRLSRIRFRFRRD